MNDKINTLLFLVIHVFIPVAAVFGLFSTGERYATAALLIGGGLCSIACSRPLAATQQRLGKLPFTPKRWSRAQPFFFVFWGCGLALIGVVHLLRR